MEKTKVVTFRVKESQLEKVDAMAKKSGFYKRSNIIEAGLKMMIALDEAGLLKRALSYHPKYDDITKLDFVIRRKVSKL